MNTIAMHMPWKDLASAFIEGIDHRLEVMSYMGKIEPLFEFREYRVLRLGGPRQCGKTETVAELLRENEHARIISNDGERYEVPPAVANDPALLAKAISKHELNEKNLKGVKLFLIDAEGFDEHMQSPYIYLEDAYKQHPEWFERDFCVVYFL